MLDYENTEMNILAMNWRKEWSFTVVWWYYAQTSYGCWFVTKVCFVQISGQKPHIIGWCLQLLFKVAAFPSLFLEGFPHIGEDTNWSIKCSRETCTLLSAWILSQGLKSGPLWALTWRAKGISKEVSCQERWRPSPPVEWGKGRSWCCVPPLPPERKGYSWWSCLHIFQAFHFW